MTEPAVEFRSVSKRLVHTEPPARAAWLGWCYGTGWLVAGVWWLFVSMHRYGQLPALLATSVPSAPVSPTIDRAPGEPTVAEHPLDDPDARGKVLYVWFDAPIGYVSFTASLCERVEGDWRRPSLDLHQVELDGRKGAVSKC